MTKKNRYSPSQKPQNHQQQALLQKVEQRLIQHAGPLPPPELMAEYDQLLPGSADRIITMAENQARHRHALEKMSIEAGIGDSKKGLWFGFLIGLAAIAGGVICVLFDHPVSGTALGMGSITSLVGVFVYGSRQKRAERERKYREVDRQDS